VKTLEYPFSAVADDAYPLASGTNRQNPSRHRVLESIYPILFTCSAMSKFFYPITVFLRTACHLACELLHCLKTPVSSGAYFRLIYSSSQQLAIASHFLISLSVPMKITVNSTQKTFQVLNSLIPQAAYLTWIK